MDPQRRNDPHINPFEAKDIETHHWPIERSLLDAVDPALVAQEYPSVRQFKTFEEWVDSEFNMLVLCDQCHRLADHAIHKALWQDFIAERFAKRDAAGHRYHVVATAKDEAQALVIDERIEHADGTEAAVTAEAGAISHGTLGS